VLYRALATPCGSEIIASDSLVNVDYGFTGYERDQQLKSLDAGARFYQPMFCAFMSIDPIDQFGWSSYAYAANNPMNVTDPDGRKIRLAAIAAYGKNQVPIERAAKLFVDALNKQFRDVLGFKHNAFYYANEIVEHDGSKFSTYVVQINGQQAQDWQRVIEAHPEIGHLADMVLSDDFIFNLNFWFGDKPPEDVRFGSVISLQRGPDARDDPTGIDAESNIWWKNDSDGTPPWATAVHELMHAHPLSTNAFSIQVVLGDKPPYTSKSLLPLPEELREQNPRQYALLDTLRHRFVHGGYIKYVFDFPESSVGLYRRLFSSEEK